MPLDLPTGVVTLLFTDVEGSTRSLQELGDGYGDAQRQPLMSNGAVQRHLPPPGASPAPLPAPVESSYPIARQPQD